MWPLSKSESTKLCTKCGEIFPATRKYFYVSAGAKDGFGNGCKACRAPSEKRHRLLRLIFTESDGYRACSKCEQLFPATLEFFWKSKTCVGGLQRAWKVCLRAEQREYSRENSEKIVARVKRWQQDNPDRLKHYRQTRIEKYGREKTRKAGREWARRNKEKGRVNRLNRLSRLKAATGSHTFEDVWEILESQNHLCAWCELPLMGVYHVDHFWPLSKDEA